MKNELELTEITDDDIRAVLWVMLDDDDQSLYSWLCSGGPDLPAWLCSDDPPPRTSPLWKHIDRFKASFS